MRRLLIVALLLAGCSSPGTTPSPSPAPIVLTGTFALTAPGSIDFARRNPATGDDGACQGNGGYSDIRAGVSVVVKDSTGTIIGTGPLLYASKASNETHCAFTFSFGIAPTDFYVVSVGNRGGVTYSRAQLEGAGWNLDLTLGQ